MTWSFRTNGNFIDFVHTDDTSLAVENVIMSLHNTSRAIAWSLPEDETRISFIINGNEYFNILISTIDFDGTVMNSQDDFETGITAMFPGLAGGEGGGGSGLGYTAYVAVLSQSGTNPPTATVLQNTIGGVAYGYNGEGDYQIVFNTPDILGANPFIIIGTTTNGLFVASRGAGDIVNILTRDDFATPANGLLDKTTIEIRVYP